MQEVIIALHGQAVEVRCPHDIADEVALLFPDNIVSAAPVQHFVVVERDRHGLFKVTDSSGGAQDNLTRGDVATFVMDAIVRALIFDLKAAVALHAGAVARNGQAVLIAGPTGTGKSSVVAWLVDNGFEYLSDELVLIVDEQAATLGLRRALVVKPGAAEKIALLTAFAASRHVLGGSHVMFSPAPRSSDQGSTTPTSRFIVFPRFVGGAELQMRAMSAAEAGLRLVECNLNARNLADGGFRALSGLARLAPAISLQYADFAQLSGTLDVLLRFTLDGGVSSSNLRRFLSALATPPAAIESSRKFAIPAPTPRRERKKLTIGMATYDDYDGVYFTLQALRIYHSDVIGEAEFLLIDNHPNGSCAEALKAFELDIPNYRYLPYRTHWGTAASRNAVFAHASGEFVLCMDCHVLVLPGALRRLMAYFAAHPDTPDLLQGPLLYDDLAAMASHLNPVWREGMYGCWECDERAKDPDAPPFDIPMQGLGLFACRRTVWPGFNARFRGFGGE